MGNYDTMEKKNNLSPRWEESTFNILPAAFRTSIEIFLNVDNGTINPQYTCLSGHS